MDRIFGALGAALALCSVAARADVVYTYTSRALDPWTAGGVTFGTDTSPLRISLDFSDDGNVLLDWMASQPTVGTINKGNTAELPDFGLNATFRLNTDSVGNVIAWYVNLYTAAPVHSDGSIGYRQNLFSFNQEIYGAPFPGAVESWDLAVLANPVWGSPPLYIGGLPGPSGTWTSTGELTNLAFDLSNPGYVPPSVVPEPGNAALVLTGIGLVAFSSRRRRY